MHATDKEFFNDLFEAKLKYMRGGYRSNCASSCQGCGRSAGRSEERRDWGLFSLRSKGPRDQKVKDVGITKRDPNVRRAEHNRPLSKTRGLDMEVQMSGVSRAEARGAEQYLFDLHGGRSALLNRNNPVAPRNQPFYAPGSEAALRRWGVIP